MLTVTTIGKIKAGDIVTCNYKGKPNGTPFKVTRTENSPGWHQLYTFAFTSTYESMTLAGGNATKVWVER